MLHSIKISNFFSFREAQLFNLDSPRSTIGERQFLSTSSGKNAAIAAVLFGGNATGKTNFLKTLPFLRWFIQNSWVMLKPDQPIPFLPFIFTRGNISPSEFEICVESVQGVTYQYYLKLDRKTIYYESLKVKDLGKKTYSSIFYRDAGHVKVYPRAQFNIGDIPKKAIRGNASLISTSIQSGINVFHDFLSAFNIVSNVDFYDVIDNDCNLYLDQLYNNKDLREMIVKTISKCDTGISSLKIIEEDLSEQEKINIFNNIKNTLFFNLDTSLFEENIKSYKADTVHLINNNEFTLPLNFESSGIRRLLPLLTKIFLTLKNGGILVYDEIEKGLHPQIIQYIIDLFYESDINTNGAQLICTSHSADCMNFLTKYQIFLVDKNNEQLSSITRLSDIRGVRNDDNYMIKYLSGKYGGVPYFA